MVNNEERREVAKRLRSLAGRYVTLGELEIVLGVDITSPDVDLDRDAKNINRLADLIDRPSTTRHGKFRTRYGRKTPCCEICGYSIGDIRWNYCPKCGAEVISDAS